MYAGGKKDDAQAEEKLVHYQNLSYETYDAN